MLTLTPLFTMMTMWVLERVAPGLLRPEQLNLLSFVGAGVVVAGSMLAALGSSKSSAGDVDAADGRTNLGDLARRHENLQ
jgi:hypothetical protein